MKQLRGLFICFRVAEYITAGFGNRLNVKDDLQVYKNARSANCDNGGRLAHSSADDYT